MRNRALAVLTIATLTCGSAHADDTNPPIGWAIAGGTATALVPLAVGGAFFANTFDTDTRNHAAIAMVSGLALAPIVSHLAVKEWARAGIFGAVPVACVVAMSVLLQLEPTSTVFGTPQDRLTFGLLISFTTLSAGIGLVDTVGAARRAVEKNATRRLTQKPPPPLPLPFASAHGGGLSVTGVF